MRSALLPRSSGGGRRAPAAPTRPESPPHSASKIFRFGAEVQNRPDRFRSALEVIADPRQEPGNDARTAALARPVPTKPSRILDAPDIVDDYYLNLLSWSSSNVLAVALANNVYLWNAATNEVSELLQLEQGDCVTSVSWAPGGSHLCVGTDSAAVQLWDASRMALVRSMRGHTARVGSLAWNPVFFAASFFSLPVAAMASARSPTSTDFGAGPGAAAAHRRRDAIDATSTYLRTRHARCVNSGSRDALVLQHDARARQHRDGHASRPPAGRHAACRGPPTAHVASGGNENICVSGTPRGRARRSRASARRGPSCASTRFLSSVLLLVLRRARAASRTAPPDGVIAVVAALAPVAAGGRTARPAKRWSGARSARARARDRRGAPAAARGPPPSRPPHALVAPPDAIAATAPQRRPPSRR